MEAVSQFSPMECVRVSSVCLHCGLSLPADRGLSPFCCPGCETVFQLLKDRDLTRYYDLKKKDRPLRPATPATLSDETFTYLDDSDFRKLYSRKPENSPEGFSKDEIMEFYLEGVHCSACVWLNEKIADWVPGVRSIRLNLGACVATVRIDSQGSFAAVAREFQRLGYRPHPVKQDEQVQLRDRENRILLIRLGLAGASAGNIMLLAVSLYAGATGGLARQFQWVSLLLYLPVLFFSGVPFYKSAWGALRTRQASIDIPVAFGILLGSVVSILNLWQGYDEVYFDSLSSLVFLLLCTRYFLRKTQQSALNDSNLMHFLTPSFVRRQDPLTQEYREVSLDRVHPGDLVQVWAGEMIPVDGVVSRGQSLLNPALLSGESRPVPVGVGTQVFAGTLNLETPLEILVSQSGRLTRIGSIFKSMEDSIQRKARIVTFSDQISKGFVFATLLLSAALFLWGSHENWHEGFNRALTIVIVTCPCAFALATPLALSIPLGRLARSGILVKGSEVLEKLSQVKSIFLDKTGTLTFGALEVIEWNTPPELDSELRTAVFALESRSRHPVAQALIRYLTPFVLPAAKNLSVEDFKETLGNGVAGVLNGKHYEIRRAESPRTDLLTPRTSIRGYAEVALYREGLKVGSILFGDQIRPESKTAVQSLQSLGIRTWILSGDQPEAIQSISRQVGISPLSCIPAASPEEKSQVLKSHPRSLMVGDGANDAPALASAYVGIAVQGGMEVSMRAADVYLTHPGIGQVHRLIVIAKETLKVIQRNFLLSLFYNLITGIAAIAGQINPLLAAILMPISALVLFISSISGTSRMNQSFKELQS